MNSQKQFMGIVPARVAAYISKLKTNFAFRHDNQNSTASKFFGSKPMEIWWLILIAPEESQTTQTE
jgi:hypothetical protein